MSLIKEFLMGVGIVTLLLIILFLATLSILRKRN
jgi:hypothetical protein